MRMWWTTRGSMDPEVIVEGDAYRVTRTRVRSEYLVTRRRDGVRVGTFRFVRKRPWRVDVVATAEDGGALPTIDRIGRATQRALINGWG
jgi:hypothetical protein